MLVDSDVLIAHLRRLPAAHEWLRRARKDRPLRVSAVSVAEVIAGMRSAERREVSALLSVFKVEGVTEVIARRAGEFKRQYMRGHNSIGLGDYLIAATADIYGHELATFNTRHFPMFEDLEPPFALVN